MGNDTKNIIDINGKRYDAVSGAYIGASHVKPATAYGPKTIRTAHPGSIDGFRRVTRSSAAGPQLAVKPAAKPAAAKIAVAPAPAVIKAAAQPAVPAVAPKAPAAKPPHSPKNVAPHTPQPAVTLMRSAVKKPVIKSPAVIKAQTRTDLLAKAPMQTVAPKISYNAVNKPRHQRAVRMIKSPAVKRYSASGNQLDGKPYPASAAPQSPSAAAAQKPAASSTAASFMPAPHMPPPMAPKHQQITSTGTSMNGFRQPTGRAANVQPRPAYRHRPVAMEPAQQAHKLDIFEQALADARSHEEVYEPAERRSKAARKRRSLLGIAAGSLAAVFVAGFLAYQNLPQLSLKVASYRAGLHASMPAHQPNGFKFGYLDYAPGNVTVNYTSPADSRQFNITQKASSWDSQALLSNFVASANSAYKTYSRAGRTVYLLGNNTATWVDSGIWYTVDGNSSLSSAQILELATSM